MASGLSPLFDKIKEVGSIKEFFKTPDIDLDVIDEYNRVIEKSADKQATLAQFTQNTNKSTADLIRSANGAVISETQKAAALKASTVAAKAQAVALKGVAIAGNMLLGIGVSMLISSVIKGIDNYIHRIDNAREAITEISSEIKEVNDTFNNTSKTVSDISRRFAQLSQGVNQITGSNKSLNTEEYEEFLSLNNQIAELFPSLPKIYNENGQAIVQLTGDVDGIVGSLQHLVDVERDLANQQLADKMPELFSNLKISSKDYDKDLTYLQNKKDAMTNVVGDFNKDMLKAAINSEETFKVHGDNAAQIVELSKLYDYAFEALDISLLRTSPNEFAVNGLDKYKIIDLQSSEDIDKEIERAFNYAVDKYGEEYNLSYDKVVSQITTINNSKSSEYDNFKQSLFAWLNTNSGSGYSMMTDNLQASIQTIIGSLDFGSLMKEYTTPEEFQNYILNNIVYPIRDDGSVQDAINSLFLTDFSKMSFKDADAMVNELINVIAKALDRDPLELKVSLGFGSYEDIKSSMADIAKRKVNAPDDYFFDYNQEAEYNRIKDELQEYAQQYSIDTQEEIVLFNKAMQDAEDNIEKAIEIYLAKKEENRQLLITEESLKQAKSYRDELGKLYDALALLRSGNATASDIRGFVEEFPGLSEYVGDLELLEEKIQELVNERLVLLREQFNGAINEETLRRLAEYSVKQEAVASSIEATTDALNNLVSAYKNVSEAMEQYNQSGFISLELLESIMSMKPEYLGALLDEWNNMENATDAYKAYMKVRLTDYITTARQQSNDDRREFLAQFHEDGDRDKYDKAVEASIDALAAKEKFAVGILENFDEWFGNLTKTSTSDFEQQIDWAANSVSNLEHEVTNLEGVLDNTNGYQAQIDAIQDVIDAQERLREGYEESAKEYNSQYENALTTGILADQGLSNQIRKKIESGEVFDIEEFIAKNVESGTESTKQQIYDAIQEAIDWYNKSTDATDNAIEINYKINDNIKEQRQITWDYFDEIIKRIHSVVEESEFLIELFSNDKLIRKTGEFTTSGLATLGQRAVNYNVYIDEAERYAEELKKIYAELSNATEYDQELIDRARELQDLQRDSILAYQEEKQAIIDLAKEGIQAQIDSMSELIDKKKELLEQDKEELDFQREMEERTKNLNSLRKQESVYALDNSEEGQQRLQTIRAEIEESEKDMDEFTYDKWHQSQTEMLDNLFSDYESLQNELMDDSERLFKNMMDVVGDNSAIISNKIKDAADSVGLILSPELNDISVSLGEYASGLEPLSNDKYGLKAIMEVLERIANKDYPTTKDPVENNGGKEEPQVPTTKDQVISKTDEPTKDKSPSDKETVKTPKVGSKVTFASGVYHSSADGTGKTGKKNLGEQVYITKFSNASYAKYPYLISEDKNGKKLLGWVGLDQLNGYASGLRSAKKDEWAWTQENGGEVIIRKSDGAMLTPVNRGDTIFNSEATKRLWDFANNNLPSVNIGVPNYSNLTNKTAVGDTQLVIENIIMNGVNDPVKFKGQLIDTLKSADVQKAVRSVSTDLIVGKSTFGINKY